MSATEPHKPSPLELARARLQALITEQDSWKSRADTQSREDAKDLGEKIERARARVGFLVRKPPSTPVDTSVPDGMCQLCADNETFPLVGCSHASMFCGLCFLRIKETNPIRNMTGNVVFDDYGMRRREVVILDGISCPYCRGVIASSEETLAEAKQLMNERRDSDAFLERDRLEDQRRAVAFQRLEEERRAREDQIRRAQIAEFARIAELNRQERDRICIIAREREQQRRRIAMGEVFPLGTVLHPLPPRYAGRRCSGDCQIPEMETLHEWHGGLARTYSEVLVIQSSRCPNCMCPIRVAWDEQEVDRLRAEDQLRIDELHSLAASDQKRHREVSAQLNERDRLLSEVSEIERLFRERLEQELVSAGENQRAREKAQAKYDRELDEAKRKWSRKHRK